MGDIPYKEKMNPKTKAIAIIIVLLFVGMVVGVVISQVSINYAKRRARNLDTAVQRLVQAFGDIYTLGTSIICMNIFLLLGLLGIYLDTFRKTKSSFIFGLLLFIGVLFIQSILSLPILQAALGYTAMNVSLLGILPNMFETIALVILLYLSME